jgi:hypothetical protein
VELVVVHCFEDDSICHSEDWVGDVFAKNVGDAHRHSFFDTNRRQSVGVLSVHLFLGVAICSGFWLDCRSTAAGEAISCILSVLKNVLAFDADVSFVVEYD